MSRPQEPAWHVTETRSAPLRASVSTVSRPQEPAWHVTETRSAPLRASVSTVSRPQAGSYKQAWLIQSGRPKFANDKHCSTACAHHHT